jgi:hypothetical protein
MSSAARHADQADAGEAHRSAVSARRSTGVNKKVKASVYPTSYLFAIGRSPARIEARQAPSGARTLVARISL